VNYICKSCYYQIRNIGLIRKYINDETCKTLVQVLIISRLEYGNALLYYIPLSLTNRLQRVQNCAARLVTRTGKRDQITPVLFQRHWLPVHFRSLYKILFHTFNVLSGTALVYLSDPIKMYTSENAPVYVLFTFEGTKCHTVMYGEKSFRASAPRLWNELSNQIKLAASKDIFCKVLKTHLFKLAYL